MPDIFKSMQSGGDSSAMGGSLELRMDHLLQGEEAVPSSTGWYISCASVCQRTR